MLKKLAFSVLALFCFTEVALAAECKIGFIRSQRVSSEAPAAKRAADKLKKEFEKRDLELQGLARELENLQASLEKNAPTMAESQRAAKQRELNDKNRDFQRRRRELQEDAQQRQNEELAFFDQSVTRVVKQVAEAEGICLVLQDAVWASPRIDITDKVIKALGDGSK